MRVQDDEFDGLRCGSHVDLAVAVSSDCGCERISIGLHRTRGQCCCGYWLLQSRLRRGAPLQMRWQWHLLWRWRQHIRWHCHWSRTVQPLRRLRGQRPLLSRRLHYVTLRGHLNPARRLRLLPVQLHRPNIVNTM